MAQASVESQYEAGARLEALSRTLHEYLQLESKFQPRLCLPAHAEHGEVSSGARDGAAHVMRCLKMWFDLPPDVLIHALNLLDRFLTKMKVRPCHVPCISVSCVNISIEAHGAAVPIDELVCISQCGCTRGDVERMSALVKEKLALAGGGAPVTALEWLRAHAALTAWAAAQRGLHRLYLALYNEREVVGQLEMVMCDASCVNLRAAELALVLLFNHLEGAAGAGGEVAEWVAECRAELARLCGAREPALQRCRALAAAALQRAATRSRHRQRLVWRLSARTRKVLRPTDRFLSRLPTIEEQNQAADTTQHRTRSGSESSSDGEESKDWPRSPVLPVYCE